MAQTSPSGINKDALDWALKALQEKQADYKKARDYYSGIHPLDFVTEKFRSAFGNALSAMRANTCPAVVDIPANRLLVSGFSSEAGSGNTDALAVATRDIWALNRMDTRAGGVMKEALKCGDSYVIVWPDTRDGKNIPILYPQKAGSCAVQFDPERPGYIVRAAKFWVDSITQKIRLTIYTADSIEKYETISDASTLPTSPGEFRPFTAKTSTGAAESWPLPNPYGKCPVFQFSNGEERKSELADVFELQNILNLTLCNLVVSMEFFAFPQRYMLGYDLAVEDPDGEGAAQLKAAMDRLWFFADPEGKFGQFDPSDPKSYLDVMREIRVMISEVSGIPPHYFSMSGQVPSGVALQILEKRLTDKVEQRQLDWGSVWGDVMLLALKMRGDVKAEGDDRLTAEWKDTAPKDSLGEVTTQVQKQQVGVSQVQSLKELGYSEKRIEEMKAEKEAERASAGTLLGAAFDSGAIG